MDSITKKVVFAILLLGAILRIWGIGFGLPYQFHQDEPIIVNHALAYGTGDFNPHFFIIPPFVSYMLFFVYAAYYLLMHFLGAIKGTEEFAIFFFRDPTTFYIIGRFFIAFIPSVLNIYLTYKLIGRFFSKKAALYGALLMAVAYLNVLNGHYLYTDNLLVTFVLLSYISMASLICKPSIKNYALSAIFIGISIATKYNAAILLPCFLAAHLISHYKGFIRSIFNIRLILFTMLIGVVFIICNPFSIFDWNFFIASVTGKIRQSQMGWVHHASYSMFEGIGAIAALAGMSGLVWLLRNDLKKGIFLALFPVIFYLHLVYASQPFPRYVLPIIPFLSVGAGYILYECFYSRAKKPFLKILIVLFSIAILVPTFVKSIKADLLFTKTDTRVQAVEWIKNNIEQGTAIAMDHLFFSPPLRQTSGQIKEKEAIIARQPELQGLKAKKLELQLKAVKDEKTYVVYYIIEGGESVGQFLTFWPVVENNIRSLKNKGVEYVVVNNMTVSKDMRAFHEEMAASYMPAIKFSPYKNTAYRRSYDEIEFTCMPVMSKELFSRQRPGPYIIIYRIK
jgi:hypothetical protein